MPTLDPEVVDVRADEQLDLTRLEPWLRANLPSATGPLTVHQFGGGHANLTYLLQFGTGEFVLRRPPLGPVAPTAHDMAREHRVLRRLVDAFPLAPRSYALCTDPAILGVDFHVTERRHGIVIRRHLPTALLDHPERNHRLGCMMVDVLADLHQVDPAAVGLHDLGRPEGVLQRQLDGWGRRWLSAKDRDIPNIERILQWLTSRVPRTQATTLLHNDYKLDNLLVDASDHTTPVAVLDWDMTTRGDPLMDLGYLLNFWNEAGDDPRWHLVAHMPTHHPDFPTRNEVVERYAQRSGLDLEPVRWYLVFGVFKLIVIIQQIFIRYQRGQTEDQRFAHYDERVLDLARKGMELARRKRPG
ncbi:MAG: phosphotransferase family protein [Acidobacteriota bacterium]|nr:phosphotransferase family protein [Acidobacteriota bacterium]